MAMIDRAPDRRHRRHRLGGQARHRSGTTPSTCSSLWGISTPNFWLGIMLIFLSAVTLGWLPASGYVSPCEDLAPEPRDDDHAGLRARQRHRRRDHAPHAQRDAAGAAERLRAHRPRQGARRAQRRAEARHAQRPDAGDHARRARVRHAALGRGADRADLHHPGLRQAHRRRGLQPRLRGRAGRRARHGDDLHHRSIFSPTSATSWSIRGCGHDGDARSDSAPSRPTRATSRRPAGAPGAGSCAARGADGRACRHRARRRWSPSSRRSIAPYDPAAAELVGGPQGAVGGATGSAPTRSGATSSRASSSARAPRSRPA